MEFKDRLKFLRETNNWSKVETAKKIGVSYSAYSNYEYGNREPNQKILLKMAEVFNTSISYLIEGKTNMMKFSESNSDEYSKYIHELSTSRKYDVLSSLLSNYNYLDSFSSEEEVSFLQEIFTFIDNYKKDIDKMDEKTLYSATNIFSTLNKLNREFIDNKFDTDFKLRSIDFHKDSFKESSTLLYDTYTKYLKDNYL